ncbi:MAG: hypothetical protein COA79_20150 [Planctomycetota bacterium]|nr:MAG: hypothetical protein COA79_20150 [Planctomycetota bacterium]
MTENMAQIQIALENDAKVTNNNGERIQLPARWDYRSGDCIKCYNKSDYYYWSTAKIQKGLMFGGKPFERWLDTIPTPTV